MPSGSGAITPERWERLNRLFQEALAELAALDAAKARLVELRFFGGLEIEETAEVMGVSPSTVSREWRMARAWLFRRLASRP